MKKQSNDDDEEEEVNFNEDGSENVESSLADKRNNVPTIKVNQFQKDKREEENKEE